jgi:transposase-like protein
MKQFPDEEPARRYLENYFWNDKPTCPTCGSSEHQHKQTRNGKGGYYRCYICKLVYTVRTGTIFERSHIPLHKWLLTLYLVTHARKGISSHQLAHALGIKQHSAWFMLQRIREAYQDDGSIELKNKVESDSVFTGGLEKNKHAFKKLNLGRGPVGKTHVLVMKERNGPVIATVLKDIKAKTVQDELNKHIHKDATLYTDEHASYQGNQFKHEVVNHFDKEFVRKLDNENENDKAHVNSAESYNALLKRAYYGIHHYWSPEHEQRYVDETSFRQNEGSQKNPSMARINSSLDKFKGKRLNYKRLTRNPNGTITVK